MPFRDKIDEYRARQQSLGIHAAGSLMTPEQKQKLLDSAADWERVANEIEAAYKQATR